MSHQRTPGLYLESFGRGPDLVMLHGWAMHGGLLRDFAGRLADRYRVTLIDLPGHGRSGPSEDYKLDALLAMLAKVAPSSAHWLGWSLGALLAIGMARAHPRRVNSLMLLAGSPRFTEGEGWPGISPALLAQMAGNLELDFPGTLKRFIGLQTQGHPDARALTRRIQARLDECLPPEPCALQGGLALLEKVDLRAALAASALPALAILGSHDRLAPKALAQPLRQLNPQLQVHELPAAHLPFLTHPEATAALVLAFLARQESKLAG
jgi:pimeloyl-[acyl-carrier protein] methyl ester esterase